MSGLSRCAEAGADIANAAIESAMTKMPSRMGRRY
jgi:hypothetical protein